jgi:hypothetical protein
MVTEPVAVATFPMAPVSSSPAEGRAGSLSARATPGRIADSINPATNTAMAWARMGFHSLKSKVFINTPGPLEQRGRKLGSARWFDVVPGIIDIVNLPKHLGVKSPQSTA